MGVGVVLLDECHHLASLWGYVIRAVLDELPEGVHVIGLTATPPVILPQAEAELYDALLGPVDFTVPTPAVVRDGHLAPYQELAYLTEPLPTEREWLAEHDTRFRELITTLHDDDEFPQLGDRAAAPSASAPPTTRPSSPGRSSRSAARSSPAPACASCAPATCRSAGAPRGEAYRQPPDLDDWLVLLEDYALRCLAPQSSGKAADRYDAIGAALRDLGFKLTRKGIRRGTSEVDRLLTGSQAKALGLVEVLAQEHDSRGEAMRALVLCDAELASQRPDDALTGVLDPAAGTARHALLAIADDDRTAPPAPAARLRPRPALPSRTTPRCCWRRSRPPPRTTSSSPSGRREVDGLLVSLQLPGRGVDAARVGGAGHAPVRRGPHDAAWSAPARCSARAGTARR